MYTKSEVIRNMKMFVSKLIESNSLKSPMLAFASPIISRIANNKIGELENYLNMIATPEGLIDVENIIPEMVNNVMMCDPFTINTSFIGDIEIGGGVIKFNIPFINKDLVLNRSDIELFKDVMLNKNQ